MRPPSIPADRCLGRNRANLEDLAARLPPGRAILGLDLGTKTIGVATSDLAAGSPRRLSSSSGRNSPADVAELIGMRPDAAGRAGPRPADQHGRLGGPARPGDARLCPQPRGPNRPADRLLGRAAVDRGGHPDAYRGRCQPQAARRGRRQDGRRLHPAGRARPAGEPEPVSPAGRDS